VPQSAEVHRTSLIDDKKIVCMYLTINLARPIFLNPWSLSVPSLVFKKSIAHIVECLKANIKFQLLSNKGSNV